MAAAPSKCIPTLARFSPRRARSWRAGSRPRLIAANNVVAHLPDLNYFVSGIAPCWSPRTVSLEFHYLLRLVQDAQFDTIYHEHFQYFSLRSISSALAAHGLAVVDVEELPTQGGSLRVYSCHATAGVAPTAAVAELAAREDAARLTDRETPYHALAAARSVKGRSARIPGRGQPGKAVGRVLRRAAGHDAAQLLRRALRMWTKPSTASAQAGVAAAGREHSDLWPGRAAETARTTC